MTSSTPYKDRENASSSKSEISNHYASPFLYTHLYKYYQSDIRLDNNIMLTHSDVSISPDHQWPDRLTCHSIPLSAPKVMTSKAYVQHKTEFKSNWSMHHYVHIESSHFCTGNINSSTEETFWGRRDLRKDNSSISNTGRCTGICQYVPSRRYDSKQTTWTALDMMTKIA